MFCFFTAICFGFLLKLKCPRNYFYGGNVTLQILVKKQRLNQICRRQNLKGKTKQETGKHVKDCTLNSPSFLVPKPLTGLLRSLTHLSWLCSSTLLLMQRMRACSQAIHWPFSSPELLFLLVTWSVKRRALLVNDILRQVAPGKRMYIEWNCLHGQLAHMRIRNYFIVNLHITEMQSGILFITKYEKNMIGRTKAHSTQVFPLTIIIKQNTAKTERISRCTFISSWTFFKVRKLVSRSVPFHCWLYPLNVHMFIVADEVRLNQTKYSTWLTDWLIDWFLWLIDWLSLGFFLF